MKQMSITINEDVLAEIAEKLQKNDPDRTIEGFGELKFSLNKDDFKDILVTISKEQISPYIKDSSIEFTEIFVGE